MRSIHDPQKLGITDYGTDYPIREGFAEAIASLFNYPEWTKENYPLT